MPWGRSALDGLGPHWNLPGQEEIRKQGWIYKESALLRQYRKRWLVLTPGRLYTFKKERVYDTPTEEV